MALPPCHVLAQFFVANNNLSCQLYQRSCDMFLGVPFNISSYSLLTYIIAKECNLALGEFVHTLGDAHIYLNHLDGVKENLTRIPRPPPMLRVKRKCDKLEEFKYEDIEIIGYSPYPSIKVDMAV